MSSVSNMFYIGVVENRMDPLKLGRCQVRIVGLHTHDKSVLPTNDLPWAYPVGPLTSASMNGIGHSPLGPVEGTSILIVFRDPPHNQQPIMMGTLGGIPQAESVTIGKLFDDAPEVVTQPATESAPAQTAPVPASQPQAKDQADAATKPATTTVTTDIPTEPPPWYKGNRVAAAAGIKALIAAADKVGLTTREQKCTLLALCGGESGWQAVPEGYVYPAPNLMRTFGYTFNGKPELAEKYAYWKGTRESFFDFVYAPENNGRGLGNTQAGDGGKYYGRGMLQITGRSNYKVYSQVMGVDILSNPDLLITDVNVSALCAAHYIKRRTPASTPANANPGYFYAAKTAVGAAANDTALAKRLKYYEYFYGTKTETTTIEAVEKTAGDPPPTTVVLGPNETFVPSPPTDGESGFKDPNKKYPLKALLKEPDTHRLARGMFDGTIVPLKNSKRVRSIPLALGQGTVDQPTIPYGAKYPFNHTYETESGHIQEFDDTPGYERTHRYHRAGTFEEIDVNGTRVTRIIGDDYQIVDRNGVIYIQGSANLTVNGNINIYCRSDANIEVAGSAKMEVGGDYDIGVTGNMSIAVGGDFKMYSSGVSSLQAGGNLEMKSGGSANLSSGASASIKAGGDIGVDGSNVWLNSGVASDAASYPLTTPGAKEALNVRMDFLSPPPLEGEKTYQFETPDQWATKDGQEFKTKTEADHGKTETVAPQEEAKPSGGASTNTVVPCAIVQNITEFTGNFRLSPNFTLGMFFDGGFNRQHRLVAQMGLTEQQIVCNLAQVAANCMEPLLSVLPEGMAGYGKLWRITSGYRQGSGHSDHGTGRAVDIGLLKPGGSARHPLTYDLIQKIERTIPYDQLILEYAPSKGWNWIHIGYRGLKAGDTSGGGVNRKQCFTMVDDKVTNKTSFVLI